MMATKFIIFALLFITCSYASPLRTTTIYYTPLIVVPLFVQDLEELQATVDEEPIYVLNADSKVEDRTANSFDIEKRSAEEIDDDDLETAAGSNVLRPLFVYRQQVAYRQRAREAIRRGRRI